MDDPQHSEWASDTGSDCLVMNVFHYYVPEMGELMKQLAQSSQKRRGLEVRLDEAKIKISFCRNATQATDANFSCYRFVETKSLEWTWVRCADIKDSDVCITQEHEHHHGSGLELLFSSVDCFVK